MDRRTNNKELCYSRDGRKKLTKSSPKEIINGVPYFMMEELDIYRIDLAKMSRAQSVVDLMNKEVYNHFKTNCPQFKIRETEPFVLQGSVADGTKVLQPNEFDYLVPMDLCDQCWKIVEANSFKSDYYYIASYSEDIEENLPVCTHNGQCHVDDDLCMEGRTSAMKVSDGYCSSIEELIGRYDADNIIVDNNLDYSMVVRVNDRGPAITVTVDYKSDDDSPGCRYSTLNIDYVPSVCIGGRYFVSTVDDQYTHLKSHNRKSKYWRESFSYEELQLMKDIREHSSTLFEIYVSFKALFADLKTCLHQDYELDERRLGHPSTYEKVRRSSPNHKRAEDRLQSHSQKSELARILCGCGLGHRYTTFYGIPSIYLKTTLFHLWKREELRGADEQTLASEYVTSLDKCVSKGVFINYFSGNTFGGK